MGRRTEAARASSVLCVLALVSSCSDAGGCTDMGAESGIAINFANVATAYPGQRLEVAACVDDTCEQVVYDGHSHPGVVVGAEVVTNDSERAVTLTVAKRNGESVFSGATRVTPEKQQVNGDGCPPTTYWANLHASGTDNLSSG